LRKTYGARELKTAWFYLVKLSVHAVKVVEDKESMADI
jgi:hypothetical protein